MKYSTFLFSIASLVAFATTPPRSAHAEAPVSLTKIGGLAGLNGAEITAYDPNTQRLFVTSGDGIEVVDFSDPTVPLFLQTITPTSDGANSAAVTSVSIYDGVLAAAVPDMDTQAAGDVFFYSTATLGFLNSVPVGSLPDMLTFTPDGTAVLVANEGEPDDGLAPTVDPPGSVSYIDLSAGIGLATVLDIDFTAFDGQEVALRSAGVRIFPMRSASNDFEPEYIAISPDGTTAFVTLQENNAVAKIDLVSLVVTDILPLGLKDHSLLGNEIDADDQDGALVLGSQPVFGMFMPDAIATVEIGGSTYFITANEGDDRGEDERIEDVTLDPAIFPNAAALQTDEAIGRLGISTFDGQLEDDGDTEFEKLFSYGARSFSIWDVNGNLVFDSGTATEVATANAGIYPDSRADAKGTEPEGVTTGSLGGRTFAFIGLERADAIAVFDISTPSAATFQDLGFDIGVDDAPEGLVFISPEVSPTGKALLVVSNEGDDDPATLAVYQIDIAPQPDITFRRSGINGPVIGDGITNRTGRGQTFRQQTRSRQSVLAFSVENGGSVGDVFRVKGFSASPRAFRITYLQRGVGNVTGALRTGRKRQFISSFSEVGFVARVARRDKTNRHLVRRISALNPGSGADVIGYNVRFR